MKKSLFITFNNIFSRQTGGEQCSYRNLNLLLKYYEVDTYIVKSNKLTKFFSSLFLFFPPFTYKNWKELDEMIFKNSYDLIFFDSSLCGIFVKHIHNKFKIPIICFYHNVEYDYLSVRFGKRLIKYPYLFLAKLNEELSLKYSTINIVLNERDKKRFFKLYKIAPQYILPISFINHKINFFNNDMNLSYYKPYILFVGSLNRSNFEAAKWFVFNVMPFLNNNINLIIVGHGFENKKNDLNASNIFVLGSVEDLSDFYICSECVVSPIFEGGGMKVKIAEALMYGKTIFGTKEAFEGYVIDGSSTILCDDANEFISNLNKFLNDPNRNIFNENSKKLFEEKYSFSITEKIFSDIIHQVNKNENSF